MIIDLEQIKRQMITVWVWYIQALLGHNSIKTTEIYTHISSENVLAIKSPIAEVQL